MKRLLLLHVGLASSVVEFGLSAQWAAQAASGDNRLNVLLITTDDLGLQLGCYGEALVQRGRLSARSVFHRSFLKADP